MWFEILPPTIIIGVALWIPQVAAGAINNLMFGKPYRKNLEEGFNRAMAYRDERIGGAPWNVLGLDDLPDEPVSK